VKRRVYDALNVLIAAEVLRKGSKMVQFNEMGNRLLRRQGPGAEPEEREAKPGQIHGKSLVIVKAQTGSFSRPEEI
jgi:hypothetical protein